LCAKLAHVCMILVMLCLIYTLNLFSFDWTPMPIATFINMPLQCSNWTLKMNAIKWINRSLYVFPSSLLHLKVFFLFTLYISVKKKLNYKQLHLHYFTWPKMIYTILHLHISTCTSALTCFVVEPYTFTCFIVEPYTLTST
jgi:hypothetical protein